MKCYIKLEQTTTVRPIENTAWDSTEGMWYADINTMDGIKDLIEKRKW